ncbi:PREDICTED: F-box and leucine-rich protein 22 [Propithecus coquereli]|uniref:F-box and leucine-rich protein 22 n=1 Tax=Propithecus coquereli TaxID=379532 RepID=UPI00063F3443|nr:PREDICTED: F-box and leucine-rich protein 22 [Propithecus coquereli]
MHITQLNRECLLHLFSFLDKDSRKNLARTCSQLHDVFEDPALWPLLHFRSLAELKKDNFLLGPALRSLSICWHSSRVQVCSIEDWLKSAFQRSICSRHESLVNDFLLQVCDRQAARTQCVKRGCAQYMLVLNPPHPKHKGAERPQTGALNELRGRLTGKGKLFPSPDAGSLWLRGTKVQAHETVLLDWKQSGPVSSESGLRLSVEGPAAGLHPKSRSSQPHWCRPGCSREPSKLSGYSSVPPRAPHLLQAGVQGDAVTAPGN